MRFLLFALIFLLFESGEASHAEFRKALVIGNTEYQAAVKLKNPVNDAADVASSLRNLGFDVTLKFNLNVRSFDSTVDKFVQDAQNADLAVFFYAGHGLQYDGGAFLVPTDSLLETESAIKRETLSAQDIITKLENASRVSVVVLDACRNNPLAEQLRKVMIGQRRSSSPVGRGLGFSESSQGKTLIIYSTAPGKEAADGSGRNSPFTAALLKHIDTSGLEIESMFKRVTAEVSQATQGRQVPVRLSALTTEVWLRPGPLSATSPSDNVLTPIIDVKIAPAPAPSPAPQLQPAPEARTSASLIQEMLIWAGFYDGFITGTMTERTLRAVKKFQESVSSAPTGELDASDLRKLTALGKKKKDSVGFAEKFDAKTGITLGIPTKLVSGAKKSAWGTNWVSSNDRIDIDTLRITDGRSLNSLYEKLKSQEGRVVTYYYPQPNSFVLAGRDPDGKSFYVRAVSDKGQIQGFSVVYSADLFPVVIAMSSSFQPAL